MENINKELKLRLDSDKNVKINNCISNDLETLKRNYSILLDYVSELESRLNKKNKVIEFLNRRLHYFEMKENGEI